jgi:hypothetical protein
MRALLRLVLLAAAFALSTWLAWWTVPIVALIWTLVSGSASGSPRSVRVPVLAAVLAWAFWLGYDGMAAGSGLGRLGERLGAVFQLPFPILVLLTLLFPALLAGSAAVIGNGLVAALPSRAREESA